MKRQAFFGIVLLLASRDAHGQKNATYAVPDVATCTRCRIELTQTNTYGNEDGPGGLPAVVYTFDKDSHGRMWAFPGDVPTIFSPGGKYFGSMARKGSGPGEVTRAISMFEMPGDSFAIVEMGGKISTFSSAGIPGRTMFIGLTQVLGIRILHWPDRVVINSSMSAASQKGYALHVVDLSTRDAVVRKSFDGDGRTELFGAAVARSITPAKGGGFWTLDERLFRITKWSDDLQPLVTLTRSPAWFKNPYAGRIGSRDTPPDAKLVSMTEDDEGLLWVVASTPSPKYRDAWSPSSTAGNDLGGRDFDYTKLFYTTIEVIDPKVQRIVARTTVPLLISRIFIDGTLGSISGESEDVPKIRVYRATLRRP